MKWKKKKTTWVFVFQKYGKCWSISLGHFIKHKPLISEECKFNFIFASTLTCIVFPFSSVVHISSSTVSQISTELHFCCPDNPITEFWSQIWSSTILQLQLQLTPRIHCLKLNPASTASFWVEKVSFVHFKKDSCRWKAKYLIGVILNLIHAGF